VKVSVVMPCYNAAPWIGVALWSLLNQTLLPHEIIVVDDGSSDDSAAIAEAFGTPVRVLRVANGGAAAARARGAAEATGDALLFMDADDLVAPDTLAAQAACLDAHPDTIALTPWRRYVCRDDAWLVRPASCPPRRKGQDDLQAWLSGWYHPPCAVLWSPAAFERSGGWDPDITVNDDGDVMMRGLVRGNRLILSQHGTAFYRRLPGEAVSLSGHRKTEGGVISRLRVLDRITAMLANEDRIAPYADALRTAYGTVLDTCPEAFADLRTRIEKATANLPSAKPARGGALTVCGAHHEAAPHNGWRMEPPDTSPAVSVVIPTYNRATTVMRAIQSVRDQDFTDFELIVVDDASTDDTAQVVEALADDRVRLLVQPANGGVCTARNRGIAAARAPLIAFLDSDDIWLPRKLSRQVELMRASPADVGLVYTGIENRTSQGAEGFVPSARGDVFADLLRINRLHGAPSTALIRAEVFDMVGGFDPALPAIEDYEMWVRIARFWRVDFIPDPLAAYFDVAEQDAAGVRRSRNLRANNDARAMFQARYAEDMCRVGTGHEFLLASARRHASEGALGRLRAARSVLRAIRHEPRALWLYGWSALLLMPPRPRDRILRAMRKIRDLARASPGDRA